MLLAHGIHNAAVIIVQMSLSILQASNYIALSPWVLLLNIKAIYLSPLLLLGLLDIITEFIDLLAYLAVSLGKGPTFIKLKKLFFVFFCTLGNS